MLAPKIDFTTWTTVFDLSEPIAIVFVFFSLLIVIGLVVYGFLCKFLKKNKFLNSKYGSIAALILGLIFGLCFASANNFNGLTKLWVKQAFAFNIALGYWMVLAVFLGLWVVIPAVAISSITFLLKTHDWKLFFKKLGFITLVALIAFGFAMMFSDNNLYVKNLNIPELKLGKEFTKQTLFGLIPLEMFDSILNSGAYAISFFLYLILLVVISVIVGLKVIKENKDLTKLNKVAVVYDYLNMVSSPTLYLFFTSYLLFDWKVLTINIFLMLLVCLLSFLSIYLMVYLYGLIKYKNRIKEYHHDTKNVFLSELPTQELVIESELLANNHYKNSRHHYDFISNTIYMIAFNMFLVYSNGNDFINNTADNKAIFWTLLVFGVIVINSLIIKHKSASGISKNVLSSILIQTKPGLQTSPLGCVDLVFVKLNKVINTHLKMVM